MARAVSSFLPIDRCQDFVQEMTRVARPNGWVEVRDFGLARSESPALMAMTQVFTQMAAARVLHPGLGPYLSRYFPRTGLRDIRYRTVTSRYGRRPTRGGQLMLIDYLALMERLTPIVARAGLASDELWRQWLMQARDQTLRCTTEVDLTAAIGRK